MTYPPLGKMINILNRRYQQHMSKALKPHGLSTSYYPVLLKVDDTPGMSINDIAKLAVMNKALVSKAVQYLLSHGYLNNAGDVKHRQRMSLSLSKKGAVVVPEIRAAVEAFQDIVLSELNAKEVEQLLGLLCRVY
jgi:DNA-binding MarR family transcriptional regulator